MKTLTEELSQLINNQVLKDSLAAPALSKFLTSITALELANGDLKAEVGFLKKKNNTVENENTKYISELALLATEIHKLETKETSVEEKRLAAIEINMENTFLKKQVVFLERQSDMILRNAEIKKTINSIVPIAVQGYEHACGFVQQENKTENSTETQG